MAVGGGGWRWVAVGGGVGGGWRLVEVGAGWYDLGFVDTGYCRNGSPGGSELVRTVVSELVVIGS